MYLLNIVLEPFSTKTEVFFLIDFSSGVKVHV